jgi:hypothetical protein
MPTGMLITTITITVMTATITTAIPILIPIPTTMAIWISAVALPASMCRG